MKKKTPKSLAGKLQPPWTPFQPATFPDDHPVTRILQNQPGWIGVYRNSRYQVQMREQECPFGPVIWLSIVRLDREVVRDWRELQRIKNELVGPLREAVEMYPAENRLVDTNNQNHLFVLPEGMAFPFGYMVRDVSDDRGIEEGSSHRQRPFETRPEGLNENIHAPIFEQPPKPKE